MILEVQISCGPLKVLISKQAPHFVSLEVGLSLSLSLSLAHSFSHSLILRLSQPLDLLAPSPKPRRRTENKLD